MRKPGLRLDRAATAHANPWPASPSADQLHLPR
jgi:hypothetical protein